MKKTLRDAMFWLGLLGVVGTFWQVAQNYRGAPSPSTESSTAAGPVPEDRASVNRTKIGGSVIQAPGGTVSKAKDVTGQPGDVGTAARTYAIADVTDSEVKGDIVQAPGGRIQGDK